MRILFHISDVPKHVLETEQMIAFSQEYNIEKICTKWYRGFVSCYNLQDMFWYEEQILRKNLLLLSSIISSKTQLSKAGQLDGQNFGPFKKSS
ncbi:hypothetical protein BpHYR1_009965 [Brachionus plicatilis]|uniref:Uncharacterized protein n=1 Tax=Brachionus plicatilis TaxID=10195 RepID=A0A3M7QIS2_BRAPC|nr:hypothetical protein BpHYR1_009965 [Brachionus plicatilis]